MIHNWLFMSLFHILHTCIELRIETVSIFCILRRLEVSLDCPFEMSQDGKLGMNYNTW